MWRQCLSLPCRTIKNDFSSPLLSRFFATVKIEPDKKLIIAATERTSYRGESLQKQESTLKIDTRNGQKFKTQEEKQQKAKLLEEMQIQQEAQKKIKELKEKEIQEKKILLNTEDSKVDQFRLRYIEIHAINILHLFYQSSSSQSNRTQPLDEVVASYFQAKNIGTNNRRMISENVYNMVRWMLLLQYITNMLKQKYPLAIKQLQTLLEKGLEKSLNFFLQEYETRIKKRKQKSFTQFSSPKADPIWGSFLNEENRKEILNWRLKYHIYTQVLNYKDLFEVNLPESEVDEASLNEDSPSHLRKLVYSIMNKAPPATRVSCPLEFYDILLDNFSGSEENSLDFCITSNTQAPTFIRINPMKVESVEQYISNLRSTSISNDDDPKNAEPSTIQCTKAEVAPFGIRLAKRYGLRSMEDYKNGLFEIQDESSQLVSEMINVKPGDIILDFCAGAGGKTLGFAYKTAEKGLIYLTDIRYQVFQNNTPSKMLIEVKSRLRRAGIQNVQPLQFNHPSLPKLKNRMDWVVLDVPCTGSGTIRRNPELKYRLDYKLLDQVIEQQRSIFDEAFQYVKQNKGKIVYSTCSILKKENEEQIEYFLNKYPQLEVERTLSMLPVPGGMDGFFCCILKFKPQQN